MSIDFDASKQFLSEDLENAIQYAIQQINMLSRHEESISHANVNVKIGSPSHGQLIDSRPTIDGHLASRNAEIIIKASYYIMHKHCLKYIIENILFINKKKNPC